MFVVIINDRILAPQQVCQDCVLAGHDGQPRLRQGKLCCAQLICNLNHCSSEPQPTAYHCQMGFKLVEIESESD